jgi:hypothetical protein
MAYTDFFADTTDCERIVRFAFHCGLQIVPNVPYRRPEAIFLSKWEEFAEIADGRHFFLLDSAQILSPFAFSYLANKDEYWLHQREGGPVLSLHAYPPYERDGKCWIPSGMLSYYETYLNTVSLEFEPAPRYLIAVYQKLVGEIKRDARLAAGAKRKYWVMPHAYSALTSGAQLNVKGVRLGDEGRGVAGA